MFRAAQLRSLFFAAEFAYAIDMGTFRWLKMCCNAADRSQVDDTIVKFDTLLQSFLIDNFLQPLHVSIVWILTNVNAPSRPTIRKATEERNVRNRRLAWSTTSKWTLTENCVQARNGATSLPDAAWNVNQTTTDKRYAIDGKSGATAMRTVATLPHTTPRTSLARRFAPRLTPT